MLANLKLLLGKTGTTAEDDLLTYLLEMATNLALETIYPFEADLSTFVLPSRYDTWVVEAAKQMYNTLGNEAVVKYSENGLSIEYAEMVGGVSAKHLNRLIPKVKVIV